ncbi:ABC transporter ATP-binding protein [Azospirillum halopraeferens]|uniref:ABC transporter ATP-binding protein n=1 Tax=Azospirillum halopraeferens TaxID=34010 RepID=UPI000400E54F|nr:ABC transporter ATP-binding protein [Azospirillum halopraeferens]
MASIRLDGVCVEFTVQQHGAQSLRQTMLQTIGVVARRRRSQRVVVQALNTVSLSLDDGDRLALVGGNGAGKTTLLRVLARIYEPQRGRVRVKGKATALFDVGFGLDWDSTGYDNVRIRAAYLGIPRAEVDRKIEEIVAFAELGDHIHLPMRTYSDGMKLRLAFATATAFDPEILLMDEWIGVGDARFLERAQQRAQAFIDRTRIFVIASHLETVQRGLCNKALWLDRGNVMAFGDIDEVLDRYAVWRGVPPNGTTDVPHDLADARNAVP